MIEPRPAGTKGVTAFHHGIEGVRSRLTILIPTLNSRNAQFNELVTELARQWQGKPVSVLAVQNDGEQTIGEIRNRLLDCADGDFACFIDDDDKIAPDYIDRILAALESDPDCVGFWVPRFLDGVAIGMAKHSLEFDRFEDWQHGVWTEYCRTPNHLNPVRTSIAKQVGFVPIPIGEDVDYAARLKPLLMNQVFINAPLYRYMQTTKP